MLSISKNQIDNQLKKYEADLYRIARVLYENPEQPGEEFYAKQVIGECLSNHGFDVDNVPGMETAFVGRFGHASLKSVGFLAEYDALPIVGHGCGHNLIAASCVGAALVLKDLIDKSSYRITVYGTPDEEFNGGKVHMVAKNIFDPQEATMQVHFSNEKTTICQHSPSATSLVFKFYGKSAHSALQPHEGINALNAVFLTFHAVDCHRQQFTKDICVPGTVIDGGGAPNTIPEYASARFHITADSMATMQEVALKLKNCAHGAALATGTEVEIIDFPVYCSFVPHARLSEWLYSSFKSIDEEVSYGPLKASTDVGNVSIVAPCALAFMRLTNNNIMMHSKEFADITVSERGLEAMIKATKVLINTALNYINSEGGL